MTADTPQVNTPDPAEPTVQELLARDFPGWRIRRSDSGHWYATPRTPVTEAQRQVGCAHTVEASTPAELSQKLTDQEQRAETAS